MRFNDLTGQRFGKLLVLGRAPRRGRHTYFRCVCDCGNNTVVESASLKVGDSKSCGCKRYEIPAPTRVHGMSRSKEHNAWSKIKGRCFNPNDNSYAYYGGRGISMAPQWKEDFERFYSDMGKAPSTAHSVDRIDTNGNYEPGNCRWATKMEQANNQRNNARFEYAGKIFTAREVVEQYGSHTNIRVFQIRVKNGWPVERALKQPIAITRPIVRGHAV